MLILTLLKRYFPGMCNISPPTFLMSKSLMVQSSSGISEVVVTVMFSKCLVPEFQYCSHFTWKRKTYLVVLVPSEHVDTHILNINHMLGKVLQRFICNIKQHVSIRYTVCFSFYLKRLILAYWLCIDLAILPYKMFKNTLCEMWKCIILLI